MAGKPGRVASYVGGRWQFLWVSPSLSYLEGNVMVRVEHWAQV